MWDLMGPKIVNPELRQDYVSPSQKNFLAKKLLTANKLRAERGMSPLGKGTSAALSRWGDEYAQKEAIDIMAKDRQGEIDRAKAEQEAMAKAEQAKALQAAGLGDMNTLTSLGLLSQTPSTPEAKPSTSAPTSRTATRGLASTGKGRSPSTMDKIQAAYADAAAAAGVDVQRMQDRIAEIEGMATEQSKGQKIAKGLAMAGDVLSGGGQQYQQMVASFDADVLTPKEKIKLLRSAEADLSAAKQRIPENQLNMLKTQLGYELSQAKLQESRRLAAQKLLSKDKLGSEEKKQLRYANSGSRAMSDILSAYKSGVPIYKIMGDNKFTEARRRAAENYGRMQSGGAINKVEEARFLDMFPTIMDSPEMRETKIENMTREFESARQIYLGDLSSSGMGSGVGVLRPPDMKDRNLMIQDLVNKEKSL